MPGMMAGQRSSGAPRTFPEAASAAHVAPQQRPGAGRALSMAATPRQRRQAHHIAQLRAMAAAAPSPAGGLPPSLRAGIESLSGLDMSGVRVHRNSPRPALLQAQAYAQGRDIHLGPGQDRHLPHEAWHVVQQARGRVAPTTGAAGIAINEDAALEREADQMGARAMQHGAGGPGRHSGIARPSALAMAEAPAQCKREVRLNTLDPSFDGTFDLDDPASVEELIKAMEKALTDAEEEEDEQRADDIKREISSTAGVQEAITQRAASAKRRAEEDGRGWTAAPGTSIEEKLGFLQDVCRIARSIIPLAINRAEENHDKNSETVDFTNTAFRCKEALTSAYAEDLQRAGIHVSNKYIHPAALERMYALVKETMPGEARTPDTKLGGLCKDYATLCYGLILQNDAGRQLNPRLGTLTNHVFVEVTVGTGEMAGETYVVDPWLGGDPMPQGEHLKQVQTKHKGIKPPGKMVLGKEKDYQASIDQTYAKANAACMTWYLNENRYRKIAEKAWLEGRTSYVVRGNM